MHLTKLFNFKYLIENMKKSKRAIFLFLLIVPIFTTLMLILSDEAVYSFTGLGWINIGLMYIIPFLLSFAMFGYVYKKNSVDFISSLPLSRKTIFVTNTIGGIALILVNQLLTLILTFIVSMFSEAIIFPGLVWDIFIYEFVAYTFMFIISNLAMTVSGNIMTQIVVTLLITFAIPTIGIFIQMIAMSEGGYIALGEYTVETIETTDSNPITVDVYADVEVAFNEPTAPIRTFEKIMMNDGSSYYSVTSIVKMLVLSIIYFAIGMYLFDNRKMEKAGESFLNQKVHLFVKSLTLIPFTIIIYSCIDSGIVEGTIILLAISLVYWFIYDLITSKKTKFLKNIVTFAAANVILLLFYWGVSTIYCNSIKNYDIKSVKKVVIDTSDIFIDDIILDNKIVITDKNEIADIFKIPKDYSYENTVSVNATIIKFLDKKEVSFRMNKDNFSKYLTKAKEKEEIIESGKIALPSILLNSETEKEIKRMLVDTSISEIENIDTFYNGGYYYYNSWHANFISGLTVYYYDEHEVKKYKFDLTSNSELQQYIIKLSNDAVKKLLSEKDDVHIKNIYEYSPQEGNRRSFYFYDSDVEIKRFIKNEDGKEIDVGKEYVIITLGYNDKFYNVHFITNNVEEIEKLSDYAEDRIFYDYNTKPAETYIEEIVDNDIDSEINSEIGFTELEYTQE